MKIRKKLSYMWRLLAGFLLSLTGMQQGTAAIPAQGEDDGGNVGNMIRPGLYAGKNHEVAFEGRGGVKTKTAIGAQPDGSVYGFVTREEQLAQNGRNMPSKNKSLLYMATPGRANTRGKMLESQPAKRRLLESSPARSRSIIGKPAQGKGRSIIGSPRRGVNRGKGNLLESQPAKRRLLESSPGKGRSIIGSPQRGLNQRKGNLLESQPAKRRLLESSPGRGKMLESQPGKGGMVESQPGKSKAIIGGSQSRLESDGLFTFSDEQKEQLVFGSRDYLWALNAEGLLERHLPDGVRVVIGQQGMVDVFDSENRSMGHFHSPAAGKMDRAMRITQEMKEMVREDGRSLG